MKKTLLLFPLIAIALVGCSSSSENSKTINYNDTADGLLERDFNTGFCYRKINSTSYSIHSYAGYDSSVNIPQMYNNCQITSIDNYAFAHNHYLYSVNIPGNIAEIGDYAFYNCEFVASYTVSSGVRKVGEGAFAKNKKIKSISLPNSVNSIGEGVFSECELLKSFAVPSSLTAIPKHAFDGCTSLESITNSSQVLSFGDYAFNNCEKLKSVVLTNATMVGKYCFANCKQLTSISFPKNISQIGENCLQNCANLEMLSVPFFGLTSTSNDVHPLGYLFGSVPFEGCYGVGQHYIPAKKATDIEDPVPVARTYYLPETLVTVEYSGTKLRDFAFENCSNLLNITFNGNLASVGQLAFRRLTQLEHIVFPASLNPYSIDETAFQFDYSLEVYFKGNLSFADATWLSSVSFVANGYTGTDVTYSFNAKGVTPAISPISSMYSIVLPDTEKFGYDFLGWSKSSTDKINLYQPGDKFYNGKNITLYAIFEPLNYSITLDANGGYFESLKLSVHYQREGLNDYVSIYYYGSNVSQPITPKDPEGKYVFTGWYKERACLNPFSFTSGLSLSSDLEIFAGWSLIDDEHEVKNIKDASHYSSPSSYYSQSNQDQMTYFVVDGYGSIYFYYKNSSTSSSYRTNFILYNVSKNFQTITSSYTYSTTYNYVSLNVTPGTVIGISTTPYLYSADMSYYFSMSYVGYPSLKFDVLLSSKVVSCAYETYPTLDIPYKDAYDFMGYYSNTTALSTQYTNDTGKFTIPFKLVENETIYARWTPTVYKVTYYLNGGTNPSHNPKTYTVESSRLYLSSATRTGYTFMGWYTEPTFENKITYIEAGSSGDLSLYALFEPTTYTGYLNFDGGVFTGPLKFTIDYQCSELGTITQNYYCGDRITQPDTPCRIGYVFGGWFKEAACINKMNFNNYIITSDLTVYASWKNNSYYPYGNLNKMSNYNSSTNYTSQSNRGYDTYFVFDTTVSATIYYKNSSSSSSYRTYLTIYNLSQGTTILSQTQTYSTSYSSYTFMANVGDVIRINTDYYSNEAYLYYYFESSAGWGMPQTCEIVALTSLTFTYKYGDCDRFLPVPLKDGYSFIGYFLGNGAKMTDSNGYLIYQLKYENVTLFAHWEPVV